MNCYSQSISILCCASHRSFTNTYISNPLPVNTYFTTASSLRFIVIWIFSGDALPPPGSSGRKSTSNTDRSSSTEGPISVSVSIRYGSSHGVCVRWVIASSYCKSLCTKLYTWLTSLTEAATGKGIFSANTISFPLVLSSSTVWR